MRYPLISSEILRFRYPDSMRFLEKSRHDFPDAQIRRRSLFRSQCLSSETVNGLRRRRLYGTPISHLRTPNIPYACRMQERNPNRITELFPFYFWKFSAFYFPFFIRIYFRNFFGKDSGNLSGKHSRKSSGNSAGIISWETVSNDSEAGNGIRRYRY